MPTYRVKFHGFALIEAENKEDAEQRFDLDDVFEEYIIDCVAEVE